MIMRQDRNFGRSLINYVHLEKKKGKKYEKHLKTPHCHKSNLTSITMNKKLPNVTNQFRFKICNMSFPIQLFVLSKKYFNYKLYFICY